MYRIFFSVLVLLFVIVGCNTTDNDSSVVIDQNIRLVFQDANGDNLLNPSYPQAITEQNTDLYYLIDGHKEKVFNANLDSPKSFHIDKGDDSAPYKYYMHLYANTILGQDTATTYIQFNDGTMDTIKVGYEYFGGSSNPSVHLTKVWYNQKLRFDPEKDGDENPLRYIVVKRSVTMK